MTHLSDFSYLERCAIWIYMYGFFIFSVYKCDKFSCLRLRSILSGELKSIVTLMMIAILVLQFLWDLTSTYVKYQEGFIDYHGQILTKPFIMLQPENQRLLRTIDYVECVTFSLEVGVFFLLQSFWNYLANAFAKKNFMSSFEFRFYIAWAIVSMSMYPILQWNYRDDLNRREAIPQLAYGIEAMIASLLGIRTHIRFQRIISLTKKNKSNNKAVERLRYYKDMNIGSSICLFSYATSVIILCVDGLTSMVINKNKFAIDCLMANLNVCVIFLWLCLILIFHPHTRALKADSPQSDDSSLPYSNNPRVQQVNESRSKSITVYNIEEDAKDITQAMSSDGKPMVSGSTIVGNNGGFMRAMTPVTVDYPYQTSDTFPLTSSAGSGRPYSPAEYKPSANVAIEDPYNSQPVMFSMVNNSAIKQSQYSIAMEPINTPRSPLAMSGPMSPTAAHSPGGPLSPTSPYSPHGAHFETNEVYHPGTNMDFQQVPMTSQMSHEFHSNQQSEQVTKEWLWQSPDRRNT
ncbi:hypothetical protein BD560DRAFT_377416 [Blakeslea trispora]|nr:hypothetical protein BD560DRAFT_377416 [Blakeslea trispora]